MNQENDFDEIDKIFIDYFKNEIVDPIPQSVQYSFDKVVKKIKKSHHYTNYLRKIAILIVSFGILTTSAVFAKEIIHYISSLFTNTTEAINTAVENGYVQEINTDYVYDSNIGVKVDYLLLDDTTLDISLIYKYMGYNEIRDVYINEFTIKNNNGLILWINSEEIKNCITEGNRISLNNNSLELDKNCYKNSLLLFSNQFSECDNIILDITSIILKTDKEAETINGNWTFDIDIDRYKLKKDTVKYSIKSNEYLERGFAEMIETSLKIDLILNTNINEKVIENNVKSFVLYDSSGKEYIDSGFNLRNLNINQSTLSLKYDISRFSKNTDKLILQIIIDEDKKIEIELYK